MEKKATITIRLAEQLKERLEQIAKSKDIPVSQLVREALKDYITKEI